MTNEQDVGDATPPPPSEVSWETRVLCAVKALEDIEAPTTPTRVKEMVGAKFASVFLPGDRLYEGARPSWEQRVDDATNALVTRKLLRRPKSKAGAESAGEVPIHTTTAGLKWVELACVVGEQVAEDTPTADRATSTPSVMAPPGVVTAPLQRRLQPPPALVQPSQTLQLEALIRVGAEPAPDPPEPVMIELNLRYGVGSKNARTVGVAGAIVRVHELWKLVGAGGDPEVVAEQYMSGELTQQQVQNIATADSAGGDWPERAIFRIWPDFEVRRQIDASCTTVKAVPAQRSFAAYGEGIVWAVIDSGVDSRHAHFQGDLVLDDPSVADLHHDFVSGSADPKMALIDEDGHGSHVAGIIAGGLQHWKPKDKHRHAFAVEKRKNNGAVGSADPILVPRPIDIELVNGVAPLAKLVSLKVLGGFGDLTARTARVMNALAYVRQKNADGGKMARIHGVNLSLGYGFLADWFACGQSPLCLEVNRLVLSGVVVVVAAGNSGYVTLTESQSDVTEFSAAITINDPGNAELAITVGSTHRDSPHTNGISYFSSRGPTGDGRPKPDLVAPGERITSVAAGQNLKNIERAQFPDAVGAPAYIEDSGTSMAAPHVSGAIAAFLSVQKEYLGQPDEIKQIFKSSATSLNRDPNFQGAGMVDLMRALQTP
jgi:serine protease AprX